jgi:uncharacterized membrane protein SpoIIM required for sporulation
VAGELTKFLQERENSYLRLEGLLARAEHGGIRKFLKSELVEFGHLYRLAAADLARARYVLRSPLLAEYLNELVGRAHHLIHRRRAPFWGGFIRLVTSEFPRTVRFESRPILLSAALILGAWMIGTLAYAMDHDWGQLVLSQPDLRSFEESLQKGPARLASGDIADSAMPVASAFIITNNIRACMVATAGGLLYGLGTLAALVFNGFLLGVVGAMFLTRGPEYDLYFWAGILPHGVLEIPAIIISGGAGFIIARGLLMPGRLSRGDALRQEGKAAMVLLGGVIVLLIFAGLIEGFITPLKVAWFPSWLKIAFAVVLFAMLIFYLTRAGLRAGQVTQPSHTLRTTTHLRLD